MLITRGMFKFNIRESFGDFQCRFHITKRGCKDQFVTGFSQLGNGAIGVRTLWHTFDKGGFHVVAQHVVDHETALIVGVGPAMITRWADVDKADFQFVC